MANNKALFLKWVKNLFYVHCVALAGDIIGLSPFIGSWFGWITSLVTVASLYCLYKLMPVHDRYRKAAIFSGIAIILSLITKISSLIYFSLVGSIFGLIGLYQEFSGHSEILLTLDHKLSKKWRTLFYWNVFGPLVVAVVGVPILIVAVVVFVLDASTSTMLVDILVDGFEIIIHAVYLVYLKRTHDVCEKYEHWVDDVVTGNEI